MPSIQPRTFFLIVAIFVLAGACHGAEDDVSASQTNQPLYNLSNDATTPLIGMGIGNLPHENIAEVVKANLAEGVILIDTAHASNNERILGEAVSSFESTSDSAHSLTRGGRSAESIKEVEPLYVVTKVWYTMLGYERTMISVRESLEELRSASSTRQIYVYMLLHWPRCNDDIPWMNCEEEENNLPQWVKDAGPPPHLNKENAFKQSWKALEDLYAEHQKLIMVSKKKPDTIMPPLIMGIGVSNFELEDMKQLIEHQPLPRVPPQIYQGNSWLVFHDPYLMNYLREHQIFFQAYAVMNGILQRRDDAPTAYNVLSGISRELTATLHSQNDDLPITEATVLLAYFVHFNIGIIPRAASAAHQLENSPRAISAILPLLTSSHINDLEMAIPALMKGEDIHTAVSFMNALSSPIQIHWVNPETNEEVLVSNIIHPGSVEVQRSHPGHKFVAYDPDRSIRKEFLVDAPYGEKQHFSVEL